MDGPQIPDAGNTSVTSAAFSAKFRSKRGKYNNSLNFIFVEVFTFLTVDVKAYLPPIHTLTVYFLKDLIEGKKRYVPMSKVVHVHVPAYDSLKIEEIFTFFMQHENVIFFMPHDKELRKMPK